MKSLFGILASGLILVLAAGPAAACRIAGPGLFPIRASYDAVAEARVVSQDGQGAEIRYGTVFDGRLDHRTARLTDDYGPEIMVNCGRPRPPVATGDRIVVILVRNRGRQAALGWTPLAQAEGTDDFFALYRAESRAAVRRRLRDRWRAVIRLGGALPLTDPARWMAPFAGGLGFAAARETSRAQLEIGPDGRVTACYPQPATLRDRWMCARLSRQRFRPPVLARERRSFYEVHWNERAGRRPV